MAIGAAIGSVVGGVMNMSAANEQSKAAKDAANRAEVNQIRATEALDQGMAVREEALDYSKQFETMLQDISKEYGDYANDMMTNWEDTFGSMRDNLVDYYNDLDPVKFSTQAKAQIGKQIDKGMEQFEETAAQSGIYTSGMKLQAAKDSQFKKAEAFAQADIAAPEQVAQAKQGFYGAFGEPARQTAEAAQGQAILNQGTAAGIGYNAVSGAREGIADMSTQYSNLYSGQAQDYAQSATGYGQAAGESAGTGVNQLMTGATSLFSSFGGSGAAAAGSLSSLFSDVRLKDNIRHVGTNKGYNIYEWDWSKEAQAFVGDTPTRGVMAQEVAKTNPSAVSMASNGYLKVNYEAL